MTKLHDENLRVKADVDRLQRVSTASGWSGVSATLRIAQRYQKALHLVMDEETRERYEVAEGGPGPCHASVAGKGA